MSELRNILLRAFSDFRVRTISHRDLSLWQSMGHTLSKTHTVLSISFLLFFHWLLLPTYSLIFLNRLPNLIFSTSTISHMFLVRSSSKPFKPCFLKNIAISVNLNSDFLLNFHLHIPVQLFHFGSHIIIILYINIIPSTSLILFSILCSR